MAKGLGKKFVISIVVALILGAISGPLVRLFSQSLFDTLDTYLFSLVGDLFLQAISMLVIPIIFISLVVGTANIGNPRKLGKMAGKTIGLYILTTVIAISIGLLMGNLFQPGVGIDRTHQAEEEAYVEEELSVIDTIKSIIPENPIEAMAEGNVLATIFMALLLGLVMAIKHEETRQIFTLFEQAQKIIMHMITLIMYTAPLGVFGLMASSIGNAGMEVLAGMAYYSVLVIVGILIQMFVVYMILLVVFVRVSPVKFYKKLIKPLLIGFSTSSSSATLPVTLETVEDELGVHNDVASFVIPLGSTLNMDGTALVQGLATIFIAQAYGIDLSVGQQITVVIMATSASIGTAGVPGVGIVMLSMILRSVDLPVEGIGLVIGVDRILDMVRSAKNVAGDAVVALVVGNTEGKFDRDVLEN
ncbi:dicarboxylate/amino acid:cation symporter [Proteinivorax hydrogeniformans]|uniref:dicarboxylate/amino acid:cation symporter n=1 Tax=Proteinivorax hydrogeniformans TaxID=1826727 RepID=UPI00338EA4A3